MFRRWIIRTLFIGLLLVCMVGWGGSYRYHCDLIHHGRNSWNVLLNWGKVNLLWDGSGDDLYEHAGWTAAVGPADSSVTYLLFPHFETETWVPNPASEEAPIGDVVLLNHSEIHALLGFILVTGPKNVSLSIPCYFLTSLSTALLWFAWRRTRPKEKGRAFPVEMGEAKR
jgi:hypothetical protein